MDARRVRPRIVVTRTPQPEPPPTPIAIKNRRGFRWRKGTPENRTDGEKREPKTT